MIPTELAVSIVMPQKHLLLLSGLPCIGMWEEIYYGSLSAVPITMWGCGVFLVISILFVNTESALGGTCCEDNTFKF